MNKLFTILRQSVEHVPEQEKVNFVRHLALTIQAGLPTFEGLKIIRKQTQSKMLRSVIDQVSTDLNSGHLLADSLSKYKHLFNDFFISIIRVGEMSGTLSGNLNYLAEEMEKSRDLKNKIRSALVYPLIILTATLGIVGFLVFFVFPKIIPIFSSLNSQLPITTRILITSAAFIQNHGIVLALGIIAFIIAFRILHQFVSPFRYFFDNLLFFIPVISAIVVDLNATNFTRVLGLLLKSGMPIVESLSVTSQTSNNLVYKRLLGVAAEKIRIGEQLASSLEKTPRAFPPLLSGMISIGENTGNLEENLLYLSEYYVKEVDRLVHTLTTILEPLLLLTMGMLVGFVAISIISPIYQLTSSVAGH